MFTAFSALPTSKPGEPPPPEFVAAIFASYAAFFLIYLGLGLFLLISSLLSDFIVPSLALEDTTLGEAFTRLGKLIRNEPGQFTLYAVLKVGLALAGYVAQSIAFYAVFLIVAAVVGLLALIVGYLLHALGVSIIVLDVLGIAIAIPVYLLLFGYIMFMAIGTVMTFLESYALYFLGGRYPMLGDLLDSSTPPPPVHPYPPPPPSYYATYPPPQ
jgi:hypothetical protein